MKSAIGTTFNIRKLLAEIILGMLPLVIQNKMHQVKFYLKLNIKPAKEDRVREFIKRCYEDIQQADIVTDLKANMKEVYKFLKWKLENYPKDITHEEMNIIQNTRYDQFFLLSTKSCSYTKSMISKYTEKVWASKITNEYSLEGYHHKPTPSCSRLPIPKNTTRKQEVLLMSKVQPR